MSNIDNIKTNLGHVIDTWQEYETWNDWLKQNAPEMFKTIRKENDLSQRGLGRILGVDETFISQIERGERLPSLAVLQKLAAYLSEQG